MSRKSSKLAFIGTVALFMAAVVLPAFGQPVTKSLTLSRPVTIANQKLQPGDYSVRFIDDQDGQIAINKGSREIAKVPYKLVKLNRPASDSAVIYSVASDGSYTISRLEFKGLNVAVSFE
ncbi:MAG TPA: hypothetical protein VLZ81_03390 [Blastocatellia bacterium]|nr:hypothetical protein [Blastocatellia bacterium]